MKVFVVAGLLCLGSIRVAAAQQISASDSKLIDSARSRYYDLQSRGLVSFHCGVKFDLSTVPVVLLPETAIQNRRLLEQTKFTIEVGRQRPQVTHSYPPQSDGISQETVAPVVNWISAIVGGFFQTWPSKGLTGPIPPFDNWVDSIRPGPNGYEITARSVDGREGLDLTSDLLVTRILSVGGKLEERPVYLPTPEGLIYSGNDVVDNTRSDGTTVVKFEIDNSVVDGFRLPQSVHMKVNKNVDVRFSLQDCTVEKAKVLTLPPTPPPKP